MIPLLAAGISLIPSIYKGIAGMKQARDAKRINPINPNYQMNQQVIDNARILGDRYGNYQMPGYGQAVNNINTGEASALAAGTQAASSGGDVLDLITKLNYNKGQNLNSLATQSAQGKEQALREYLQANAAAGEEYQAMNAYQRAEYDKKIREKAALLQQGNENIYGAINDAATAGTNFFNPKTDSTKPTV